MEGTKYSVANRIKTIRQILGFKQNAMANMLKVTQQSYCQIENSKDVQTSTVYRVSQVLGVDAALIVSPSIPINEETVRQFSLNNETNLVEELLDLRKKVVSYKNIIRSIMSEAENIGTDAKSIPAMMNA